METREPLMSPHSYLVQVLDEIEEFLEGRADAEGGPDGYRPNRAMQLLTSLAEARTQWARDSLSGPEDAAKRDAERYRFLRDKSDPDDGQPYITRHEMNSWGRWYYTYDAGEAADREVDKAMRNSRSATHSEGEK